MKFESAPDQAGEFAPEIPVAPEAPVWKETAERVAEALDADVYLFNGRIERQYDRHLFDHVRKWTLAGRTSSSSL
jgi:hypothetical protein